MVRTALKTPQSTSGGCPLQSGQAVPWMSACKLNMSADLVYGPEGRHPWDVPECENWFLPFPPSDEVASHGLRMYLLEDAVPSPFNNYFSKSKRTVPGIHQVSQLPAALGPDCASAKVDEW